MAVKPIPDGFHTVTPYLLSKGVKELLVFLEKAFEAEIKEKHESKEGHVMHASVRIGDSMIMLGEAQGEWQPILGMLYLYVKDVDNFYNRAIAAGAKSLREPRAPKAGHRFHRRGCEQD